MRKYFLVLLCLSFGLILQGSGDPVNGDSTSYKCLVQLTNYQGEGVYMIISLIDPEGKYEQTLYVMGEDEEWYPDLEEWWAFEQVAGEDIDAITGATISGGERAMCAFQVDKDKIDAGYTLRFETAVEEQNYHVNDLELALTGANSTGKFDGSGYIRYIRIMAN